MKHKDRTVDAEEPSNRSAPSSRAEDDIRYRAYMLSVNRSSLAGDPTQDWLTAEQEYYERERENSATARSETVR